MRSIAAVAAVAAVVVAAARGATTGQVDSSDHPTIATACRTRCAPQPAPLPVAAVAPRRGATAAPRTAPTRQNRRWVDFDGGTLKCCSVIYLLVLIGGIVYLCEANHNTSATKTRHVNKNKK